MKNRAGTSDFVGIVTAGSKKQGAKRRQNDFIHVNKKPLRVENKEANTVAPTI